MIKPEEIVDFNLGNVKKVRIIITQSIDSKSEGFSDIETTEAIVEIIDAHLIEDTEYAVMELRGFEPLTL